MRAWFAFVALFLAMATGLAQQRVVFEERFDDNTRGWDIIDQDGLTTEVADGVLRWNKADEDGYRLDWKTVDIDWNQDWTITIRTNARSGSTKYGYGLVWSVLDRSNYYMLAITDDQYVTIARRKEDAYEDLLKWTECKAVRETGGWNTLRVQKRGDALACFVNDTYVGGYTHSFRTWFGSKVGIVVSADHDVSFDDLVVTTRPKDAVRPVAGIDTTQRRRRLPNTVNSVGSDYVDGFLPDGSAMYISRADHPDNVPPIDRRDLWISRRNDHGGWERAMTLGRPINNEGNNFLVTAMPDGNTLYLQNTYDGNGGSAGGGISVSRRSGDSWSLPTTVEIDDYYNLADGVVCYVAPNGKVMLLSMQRRDSRGDIDLYVSFLREDGSWSAPANLGDTLNTIGGDMGPFVAADDRTMVFASNGHAGYGGYDLFITRRLDDTWLRWSVPENLGPTVNSDDHDLFLQFPIKGDSAYFSSNTSDMSADIFSIVLPRGARPVASAVVRGRVLDAVTKRPVPASVVYERLRDGKREGEATANPATGEYAVAVSGGANYGVRAVASGYYPLSITMDIANITSYDERTQDLLLVPIEQDAVIRLNNVFFDSGKYDLRPESFPELDRLVEFLRTNGSVRIALAGHTDNVGADAANLTLSQDRINSVESYLVAKGIVKDRLTAKGYGETRPLTTNDTEDGRRQNRRVEFTILSK
jgi:outer membrane protein OmpA-like peptidoglycan-associated protein